MDANFHPIDFRCGGIGIECQEFFVGIGDLNASDEETVGLYLSGALPCC